MVTNFADPENIAVPLLLPITSEARAIARNFAARQTTQQAEVVLYNTLAVLTVQSYLEMLGIPTDLSHSDSWNPLMQACDDVADLDLVDLGKLECRPLKSSELSCRVPMQVWELRLGYVAVRIDDALKKAELLGFVEQVNREQLAIANLQPLETLIDRLHQVEDVNYSSIVELGQWLNGAFTAGWSAVENLLAPEQLTPTWGFRNVETNDDTNSNDVNLGVRRAKSIDLGVRLGELQVILLAEIAPEPDGSLAVTLQVHPHSNDAYLPENLMLKVLEPSGAVFTEVQARSRDNFVQLQFTGQPEEHFAVQIILEDAELTEQFKL